ncbi:MAG: SemiSWEET transporter [Desulfobacterota bacterium]|nr:SemiSWEET transporter [Thermodesulfobacteriota bacterium]
MLFRKAGMDVEVSSMIGLVAGVCTTGSLLPQVWKALRTRTTRDISLVTYILLCVGIFFWCVYGLLIREVPIVLANGVSLIFAVIVLLLKLRHG